MKKQVYVYFFIWASGNKNKCLTLRRWNICSSDIFLKDRCRSETWVEEFKVFLPLKSNCIHWQILSCFKQFYFKIILACCIKLVSILTFLTLNKWVNALIQLKNFVISHDISFLFSGRFQNKENDTDTWNRFVNVTVGFKKIPCRLFCKPRPTATFED